MYIFIDRDYKISQSPILSGRNAVAVRRGQLSVVQVRPVSPGSRELKVVGMNLPESPEEKRDGEWSEIQQD